MLFRKQVVTFKQQANANSPETLAATLGTADKMPQVFDVTFTPSIEQYERNPFKTTIGQRKPLAGIKTAELSFQTELVHGETGSPIWADLMDASMMEEFDVKTIGFTCAASELDDTDYRAAITSDGLQTDLVYLAHVYTNADETQGVLYYMGTALVDANVLSGPFAAVVAIAQGAADTTVAYKPTSVTSESLPVTLVHWNDGLANRIGSARGSVSLEARVGEPVKMMWRFTGSWEETADEETATPTYSTIDPPQFFSADLSFLGASSCVESVTIDLANDLQYKNCANEASGIDGTIITSRAPSASIDPEAVLAATHDFYANMKTNVEGELSYTYGAVGNGFKVAAPKSQYTNLSLADRSGLSTFNIDLSLNENAGDDELEIIVL